VVDFIYFMLKFVYPLISQNWGVTGNLVWRSFQT